MMKKRTFLALAAATMVAACVQPALFSEQQIRDVAFRSVTVDVSKYEGIKGRDLTVSPEKLKGDLEPLIAAQLGVSPAGNADAVITIEKVGLVSPGQSFLIGGTSTIVADVVVKNTAGEIIVPTTRVVGTSEGYAPGGIIGALATKSVEQDYQSTISAFAQKVKKSLYGAQN
ncbi:MAG: hypothetical protein VX248_16890 [Pseudomonadota bacterium]|nr:hypothetical protein [Pseudomonadota bacterium]